MKNFKVLSSLFIVFLLVGCGSSRTRSIEVAKTNQYPSWYGISKDTNKFIFSLGSGVNKDTAVANALKNAVSKLSVSVESSFEVNKTVTNGRYNRDIKDTIKTSVAKININNYEIVEFKRIKYNESIVKVKIDKTKLVSYLKDNLTQEINSLLEVEKQLSKTNAIKQLVVYKSLYEKLNDKLPMMYIISQLDNTFNIKYHKNIINEIHKKYLNKQNNTKVSIKNIKGAKSFIDSLSDYLTSKNIKIVNKSNVNITLDINRNYSKTQYFDIVIYTINLKTVYKNNIVGNRKYEMKLHNKGDVKRLDEKASKQFLAKIQGMSLMEVFSFQEQ
jgi:hypothetical protein